MGLSLLRLSLVYFCICIFCLFQGVGHSVRRFVSQLAIILGPVWGAATLMSPYLMLLVPLVMLVIGSVLYAVSFKKFSSHFF